MMPLSGFSPYVSAAAVDGNVGSGFSFSSTSSSTSLSDISLEALHESGCAEPCLHTACAGNVCTLEDLLCTTHECTKHEASHHHFVGCGHEPVVHEGHLDFIVDQHVHHEHSGHCDNHGSVQDFSFLDNCACDFSDILSMSKISGDSGKEGDKSNVGKHGGANSSKSSSNPGTHQTDGDYFNINMAEKNCKICSKPKFRVAKPIKEKNPWQRHAIISKFVKRKYQDNITKESPLNILKGLSPEGIRRIGRICKQEFSIQCTTILELSQLSDSIISTIVRLEPKLLRSLPSIQQNAKLIVDPEKLKDFVRRSNNAHCCARFRQKKKNKINELNETIEYNLQRATQLREQINILEEQRNRLLLEIQNTDIIFSY